MTILNQSSTQGGDAGIVGGGIGDGPGPDVMAAATIDGNKVLSSDGEDVGKIHDIMLDVRSGRIAYAVLAEGGFAPRHSVERADARYGRQVFSRRHYGAETQG
jgi:sporulation protein YlmC with PRC-barrel domain